MVKFTLLLCVALAWAGCDDEPDHVVRATTSDGRFALTLEAAASWLRPGDSVPILVRLESLAGPLPQGFAGTIELLANNGSIVPSLIQVSRADSDTTAAVGADRTGIARWVQYTASSYVASGEQAEIYAMFQDTHATLQLRITPLEQQ